MNTTVLRARKLLITAGYYSTEMSRKVRELHEQGVPVSGIMEATRLGQASVYSYLPYLGLAWNLEERTANADRLRAYRCVRESENGCKARKIKGRRRFRNKASLTSLPIYSKISSV